MKKNLLMPFIAFGLLAGAGCATPSELPDNSAIQTSVPEGVKLPMRRVSLLGKNVDKTAEITTLDTQSPYSVEIPRGFGAVGSGLNSMVCVSPQEASVRFFTKENLPGAKLNFWRNVLYRTLKEEHGYKILNEQGFKTTENLDAWKITGIRTIERENYKYKLVVITFDKTLYMAEYYGKEAVFNANEKAFDDAVDTMNLAFWRIIHGRDNTEPFFAYDPVKVTPKSDNGLFGPDWTILQLGFFPYGQIFDSKSNVYGLGLNLFVMDQNTTCGISYALFNAVKESYGIHLAPLWGSTEKNYGLSIGLIYNQIRENNGLSIGLINRAEKNSHGVQIGLLNFNTDPDYFYCFPIINLPVFALFK